MPGGLHQQDIVINLLSMPRAVQDEVQAMRQEPEVELPVDEDAERPIPRTVGEALGGPSADWWRGRAWDDARHLHGSTLIDVPKATRAAFADLKLDVIGEVEKAETSEAKEEAWLKLSFVDALILNSVRSPGESQTQAVVRRVRHCLLYTSPSPRDLSTSRMPSSA